jgi:uncharacterized protein (DUF362 family)/NAD-dependent dihydropyrimidine dehydrogenase PreA subunit
MVQLVLEAGAQPIIGDSPGGPFTAAWVRPMYRTAGWQAVAEETAAILNMDFTDTYVSIPEGKAIKGVELGNYVTSADVVITLPKLKTHGLMHLTGGIKILFGAIPGTLKLAYHAKFPDRQQFADMLIDILNYVQPAFSLMDAIEGMDGAGPTAGSPFSTGAILASADSVALDIAAAGLVKFDPQHIPSIQAAVRRGLSSGKVDDIKFLGDKLSDFNIIGFRSPETRAERNSIRIFLGRHLRSLAKDAMVAVPSATSACIACGICERSCPVEAITITDNRARMDLKKCIRCYCCHELCPQRAIILKRPLLGRLVGQWR